jgi:xylan 1,4-beta-xylosidase
MNLNKPKTNRLKALIFLITLFTLGFISFSPIYAQKQKKTKEEEKVRLISADVLDLKGKLNTQFKECVGAGRANEGLRADWQSQLTYLKKECDFKFIRMHGLFTDDMGVYREDKKGNPEYNWQYVDVLYDFLLSIKMKPFVEIGFMPEALASGKETIFWWKGNVTPPKDYKKWEMLIRAMMQHFTERYGEEEVSTWYFEVWNEPNLTPWFFTGTMADYFKLYDVTSRPIKSVSPKYKVGGPATAGSAWIPEFIKFCKENNSPVDFVSTHCYGVNQGYLDEYGQAGTVLAPDPKSIWAEMKRSRKQIRESALPNLELHYTEWSSSYTPADPFHDSYHSAAFILDKIRNVGDDVNSMSYWVFTDIFEEPGPRFTPFHGGFGLINYQGINKPAFYSYQFLNRLGETEIKSNDPASWVCKNKQGDVQVLFWNFTLTHTADSVNNQVLYKRDLPSASAGKTKISLKNMSAGKYTMEVYKTGYKVNDPYATYLEIGSPSQLAPPQVDALKKNSNGTPVLTKIINAEAGKDLNLEFDMRENDVYFISLVKL